MCVYSWDCWYAANSMVPRQLDGTLLTMQATFLDAYKVLPLPLPLPLPSPAILDERNILPGPQPEFLGIE
jgi:hypothetical protein